VEKEVEFTGCVGHGVKPHVLQAKWSGVTIIMKDNGFPKFLDEEFLLLLISTYAITQKPLSIRAEQFVKVVSLL